eukprot:s322_g13.t1
MAEIDLPDEELPPLQQAKQANPGQLWRLDRESLKETEKSIIESLKSHHHELLVRFDEQQELIENMIKHAPPSQQRTLVIKQLSDGASSSSASDASAGKANRKDDKKPTLFSTFTTHDMQLRMEATNVSASHSVQATQEWVPPPANLQSRFVKSVKSNSFDVFFSMVVISNAIFIGIDVQLNPTMAMSPRTPVMVAVQYFYTVLFCIELGLRAAAYGKEYFCSQDWAWAALDVFIVLTSFWEVFVDTWYAVVGEDSSSIDNFGGLAGLRAFRIVRITRIVKTVRLMRIFRFVLALRTLIYSILHTLKALFWALVLLFLIVYVFALIFTQAVNGHLHDPEAAQLPAAELEVSLTFYGTLIDTMSSLFMSVTDGVSWEKIYRPLHLISPFWSFLFLFYVCFVYFAVLNVLTAVFCQSAIESAENDHATAVQNMMANKEMHLKKIRALFSQLGTEESGIITFGQFESKIHSPEVREYFETLGLDAFLPALAGYRRVPVLGQTRVALPQLQRDGCLSGNMHRWTRTPTFTILLEVRREKDGLIACSALNDVPESWDKFWAVSAGGKHACALRADGRLTCFGDNEYGQCDVPADLGPVSAVSAGAAHTCALRADGRLICFGDNKHGQCGVPADLGPAVAVSAGNEHTCAVRADGWLICFGYNYSGQCDVPADLGPVSAVSAGAAHTCAMRADGRLICFGNNEYGQCGVPADLGPVLEVSAGAMHTCAVRADGRLICFGMNLFGQCGVPADLRPVSGGVPANLVPVSAVSAGECHTCAVRTDGQLICFGFERTPRQCDVPADLGPVSAVSAGFFISCAVQADGRLIILEF